MALDGMYLSFLVREVNELLVGAKVDKIHQPSKNELVFIMRIRGVMYKLYFTADANSPRFAVVDKTPENPQTPPMLCMLLRKYFIGGKIIAVDQPGFDRIARFTVTHYDEMGYLKEKKIVCEIMGKYANLMLLDSEDKEVAPGENGEICIRVADGAPCGLFKGYYNDPETNARVWHDGYYHTGDQASMDEDGYLWYVGRIDDVIKSSGYRIGPFEIESVIMELPYVLECGVSAAPDEVRGQIVKASIVLTPDAEPTEELKKEIQRYVKEHTAPYKYPRLVVFRDELPKTSSGKIRRNML